MASGSVGGLSGLYKNLKAMIGGSQVIVGILDSYKNSVCAPPPVRSLDLLILTFLFPLFSADGDREAGRVGAAARAG